MSGRRLLYTALLYWLVPLLVLRLCWRSRHNPALRQRLGERLATGNSRSPSVNTPLICLHAVSVGETMAAQPLIEALLKAYPDHTLWITSTTLTGSQTVQRLFAGRVQHSYLPYDLPGAVARFLDRLQPVLFLVMETELWPNLYAACGQRGIPLVLVNARLSARSARGYARFSGLVAETLSPVQTIAARDAQDAERFQALGAAPSQLQVLGNIKFDLHIAANTGAEGRVLRAAWGVRPVWVAGSTHAGEDDSVLQAHARVRQHFPDLLLILVPRHPERFDAVAALCVQQGFSVVRRSSGQAVVAETAVLLGDSMGELLLWYAASDVAFIGGSLVPVGGHNPLEAAGFNLPVLSGAHVHNFADVYAALVAAGGAVVLESATDLAENLVHWLGDTVARQASGQAAGAFLHSHQGVVKRLLGLIHPLLTKY